MVSRTGRRQGCWLYRRLFTLLLVDDYYLDIDMTYHDELHPKLGLLSRVDTEVEFITYVEANSSMELKRLVTIPR
jgi:hypothetical protein